MSFLISYLKISKSFIIFSLAVCSGFRIERHDNFPIHVNSLFLIRFESKKIYSPFSLMTLLIKDNHQSVVSKSIINPGISSQIENQITDKYISVSNWYKDKYQAIHLYVKFFPPANNLTFQIRYKEIESAQDRSKYLESPSLMDEVFSQTIALIIDPTLDFFISTKDGRKDGVIFDDIAFISCKSMGGIPPSRPILQYVDKLKVHSRKFFPEENKMVVHIYVTKSDHNKDIRCNSGGTISTITIKVFHHPTNLAFSPSYSDTMPNGSSILCKALDGYPSPHINWQFISGPTNATQFFTIHGNNLTMLSHCPLDTSWTFNCSALNSIPKSYDIGTTKTFSFKVSPGNQVAAAVIATIVSVIILLILIFVFMKKKDKLKEKLKFSKSKKFGKKNPGNEEEMNNNFSQYYTYGEQQRSDNENSEKSHGRKPKKKQKKDTMTDSQHEEFIV